MRKIEEIVAELVRNMGYIIDELNDKYSMTVEEIKEYKRAMRVIELCNAERENKCVVLPCKVGDTVSAIVNRPYNGHAATIYGEVSDIQTVVRVSHSGCRHVDFLASDFGVTVFPMEEAENALKGEGHE